MNILNLADDYISENLSEFMALTVELCRIPSATGSEGEKALYIKSRILEYTGENVKIDEAGNVVYIIRGSKSSNLLLAAAHIDTVFKNVHRIDVIDRDGKLYAPSIMDNSINAAALLFIIKMFRDLKVEIFRDIVIAFTVGEEGTGNLKGIKNVMEILKDKVEEVIAVDCNLDCVVNRAVGSKRYEVSFKTKGGHSWSDFGNKNSILYAARLVEELYNIKVPDLPKTTYNAGIISGGTSVNTIAEDAKVLIDLRSEDKSCLDDLNMDFLTIIDKLRCDDVNINVEPIGDRPCGSVEEDSKLICSVLETRKELGLGNRLISASTDANIPLSLGIPAVAFGVCRGEGTHTIGEFLYTDSIETGLKNLIRLIIKLTYKA